MFAARSLVDSPALACADVRCDGCDPARLREERATGTLMLGLTGAFEVRHPGGRVVVAPGRGLWLEAGTPYVVRHPAGPDRCLSLEGELLAALPFASDGALSLDPLGHARLVALCQRPTTVLELEAALVAAATPVMRPRLGSDGAIARRLQLAIEQQALGPASLASLARAAGVSPFHAAHAYRRATGQTLHAALMAERLAHALALVVAGEPLAQVAARTGFASQAHLTNRFRRHFGRPPAALRRSYLVPNRRSPASPSPGTM